jgi:hypothetical protein
MNFSFNNEHHDVGILRSNESVAHLNGVGDVNNTNNENYFNNFNFNGVFKSLYVLFFKSFKKSNNFKVYGKLLNKNTDADDENTTVDFENKKNKEKKNLYFNLVQTQTFDITVVDDQEVNASHNHNDNNADKNDVEDDDLVENYENYGHKRGAQKHATKSHSIFKIFKIFNEFSSTLKTTSVHIIESKLFENSVILLILLSSITLAIDNPLLNPRSQLFKALKVCDVLFTTMFTVEMVLKMIALGLFSNENNNNNNKIQNSNEIDVEEINNNKNNNEKNNEKNKPYFNVGSNVLDFSIVVVSILSLADVGGGSRTKSLKALRALRALRPLRLMHRLNGLKVIITAVFQSVTAVAQLATIYLLIYFMFAIFFTSFLKGQMRSCQGEVFEKNVLFSKNNSYYNLLLHPKHFSTLNEFEKSWFGPNSTLNLNFKNSSSCVTKFENNEPCCEFNKYNVFKTTSRDICECWLGEWSTDTVYRFFIFFIRTDCF